MLPVEFYTQNLSELQQKKSILHKKKRALGLIRFGNIILLLIIFYYLYSVNVVFAIGSAIILLFIFTRLIYSDLANNRSISHLEKLIVIQQQEIDLLHHKWHGPTGEQYLSYEHMYANDMDIFGHASLFQLVNRTSTEPGQDKLASWLLSPSAPEKIMLRQEAIKELTSESAWRHDLIAYGRGSNLNNKTVERLKSWISQPTIFLQWRPWKVFRWILPLPVLAITFLTIFEVTPLSWLIITLFFYSVIAYQVNKLVSPLHDQLSKIVDQLETVSDSIAHIETKKFRSALLISLKNQFENEISASSQLKQLNRILERLDLRYNIVLSAPLNLLLLWNLQQVLDLEQWKKDNGHHITAWIDALTEFECINSLSALAFNNPGWSFPVIDDSHFHLEASKLGHPLILPGKMISNDFKIGREEYIILVTGSNMAGKSTFLRSLGIAVIMGMCGAPVCAESLSFSKVQLMSSMRITDNLEESTSTFYAELKKLKLIIEAVNRSEKVLILLDEILRGTNSMDRHKGSEALIKQLIRMQSYSVIATHDLGLADLVKDFPETVENYHFDVSIKGEDLYFDYLLKDGVCKSLNATLLMKKIGLEVK